jgi:biotin operon repressor
MQTIPNTLQPLRSRNRALLLRHVIDYGASSRAEIAEALGISKVTITSIANDLVTDGLLIETGRTEGASGRPAALVELHPKLGTVLGVDVQPQVITSSAGGIATSEQRTLETKVTSKGITAILLAQLESNRKERAFGPLRHIMVSVPAPVNAEGNLSEPSRVPDLNLERVMAWAKDHQIELQFENDVKLASLAEHHHGAAQNMPNFALLVEREGGVALGLMIDGQLYRGERGRAGEISLLRLPHNNRLVPLEKLPFKAREEALAQMVSGFAIALDLGLILIHQHPPGKKQLNLTGRIRELMTSDIRVENSYFGERGPLQGALISSALAAQHWLYETGGSTF